ncbi:MAG: hypothetical protein OFPII_22260 [Osedax symbiont Rs1]|nr:MAG: hypothetical protein OFPII_22260 [Osedax symbiont Rs1]
MKNQRGGTLVELMIASLLGLMLSAVILSTLYAAMKSNALKTSAESMQENSSLALFFLANDLRSIGFAGCYEQGISNLSNHSKGPVSQFLAEFSIISGNTLAYKNSDSISFVTVLNAGVDTVADMSTVHSRVDLIKNKWIEEQQELLITDCTHADIFTVSDIWRYQLSHEMPSNSSANLSHSYKQGALVYPLSLISYYLAKGASGRTGLYRKINNKNGHEIIPNVEMLIIRYGVRSAVNQRVRYYAADQHFDSEQVVSVQLQLLLSSHNQVLDVAMQYQDLHNNTVQADDLRLYKVFNLDITLRNRG